MKERLEDLKERMMIYGEALHIEMNPSILQQIGKWYVYSILKIPITSSPTVKFNSVEVEYEKPPDERIGWKQYEMKEIKF